MDQFDSDAVTLASAMTYNELGLVVNGYDGGYNYGDSVATIDMNDEGVAMLEDNLFCSKAFAQSNPNTVKAFVSASMKAGITPASIRTKQHRSFLRLVPPYPPITRRTWQRKWQSWLPRI